MRDLQYEDTWFEQLVKTSEQQGINVAALVDYAKRRLTMGAEQYGDEAYLTKDIVKEAHDEAADLINYALLETHKRNELNHEDGGHHYLFAAAQHAAMADHYLRMSRAGF